MRDAADTDMPHIFNSAGCKKRKKRNPRVRKSRGDAHHEKNGIGSANTTYPLSVSRSHWL